MSQKRIIMHIDVNSAFLSWQAAYDLQHGGQIDLREIPSAVGGNQADRKGIVLAKSIPAKAFGIQTGETLMEARQKCPELVVVPPNHDLYVKASNALYELVQEYSPAVQRFSVDEMFMDYTNMDMHFGPAVEAAHEIKDRIKQQLGFTVNVGIAHNKLLAKVAGDLKKPDLVHTLMNQEEIELKMWPLPVEDLFMVGRATKKKLYELKIYTIGELARADRKLLHSKLKSFGNTVWCYANGIDESPVHSGRYIPMKGVGNSTTTRQDVCSCQEAYKVLLSLTETVAMRLRQVNACGRVISVEFRSSDLQGYSHQRAILGYTNCTIEIYSVVKELFKEGWKGEELRHLGVSVTDIICDDFMQTTLFDHERKGKKIALDEAIDQMRIKYGKNAILRAVFADGSYAPMTGGAGAEDYPVMSNLL